MGLCLVASQRATTWQHEQSQNTTIDLTFLIPRLYNHLVQSTPLDLAEEMKDHAAVETILGDILIMASVREHWFWKNMNVAQVPGIFMFPGLSPPRAP